MIKFFLTVGAELIFSPFLYLFEEIKKLTGRYVPEVEKHIDNVKKIDKEVLYVIHDWAGYPFVRKKDIPRVNKTFNCGLKFQLERIQSYNGKLKLRKILTISDCSDDYIKGLKDQAYYTRDLEIYPVSNAAMDFSGYNFVAHHIIDTAKEQIVFLTNTSVNAEMESFLDEYVSVFESQPDLGMLGISYCTTLRQSFIRNNFRPHLQSFFLVMRSSVLTKILNYNQGDFPGAKETYKLSIIRFGEVKLTEIVQKLGYKVSVITEDGKISAFPHFGFFYNGYSKWKLPMSDYRLTAEHPNKINVLKMLMIIIFLGFSSISNGCAGDTQNLSSLRDKQSNFLSVKDYGAKGDGKTDDTKAFQAALDQGVGKTVFLPMGNYLISKTLYLTSGTELLGEGDVGGDGGSSILTKSIDNSIAIFSARSNKLSDIIFRNIRTLRGKYALSLNVKDGYLTKIKWYNCVFQEHEICINIYGSQTEGMYANTFRDCYFKASKMAISSDGPFNINCIQNCGFENMGNGYITLGASSTGNLANSFVQNRCESVSNRAGVGISLSSKTSGFYITGNYFENCFDALFKTNGALNVEFSNNVSTNGQADRPSLLFINGGEASLRNNISNTGFILDISNNGICSELFGNKFMNFTKSLIKSQFGKVYNDYNKKFNN